MTSQTTNYTPGDKIEIRLPAGWRAGHVKRVIPNYTPSGGTVYEIAGKGFVSIASAATLRHISANSVISSTSKSDIG